MQNKIDLDATLFTTVTNNPELVDLLVEFGFEGLKKPGMLQTAGKVMTLRKGAKMKKKEISELIEVLETAGYEVEENDNN